MTTQEIEICKITWPKATKDDRTRDKDFVKKLALSIETEGMHQPIVVRPDPEASGRYLGVIGWHRAAAVGEVLRRGMIEAKVAVDMDEEEAWIARVSENLFRNPLSKTQQARAIATWHDYYDRKHQEYEAEVRARKDACRKPVGRPRKVATDADNSGPQHQPGNATGNFPGTIGAECAEPISLSSVVGSPAEVGRSAGPPANFAEHAAKITGQSPTTIRRSLKIGKAFTDDQLACFEQYFVSPVWMETIAKFDESERDAIVNMIASGLEPQEAIAKVEETPEVTRADGRTFEVSGAPEGSGKSEGQMTDDEWARIHCAETIALLPDPAIFISHAIVYRAISGIRQEFKTKTKKTLAEAKKVGLSGGFIAIASKLAKVSHPKHWLRCGSCSGHGSVTRGDAQDKCRECWGNGFVVKIEWS